MSEQSDMTDQAKELRDAAVRMLGAFVIDEQAAASIVDAILLSAKCSTLAVMSAAHGLGGNK